MDRLPPEVEQLCAASPYDFSDLKAVFVNCTLKRSPEVSNTEGLADLAMTIMRRAGVEVELIRAVDHAIATGVWPDMTEHGWARDDWPAIFETVIAADILGGIPAYGNQRTAWDAGTRFDLANPEHRV